MTGKDPSQMGNPEDCHNPRVSKMISSILSQICPTRENPEVGQFEYSYWLGVSLLLQSHPCSPSVVGGFKQLLNNCKESAGYPDFIEAMAYIRSHLTENGCMLSNLFKGSKPRWVRGLVNAITSAIPATLITHPSPTFNAVVTFLGWLKRLPVFIRPEAEALDAYYENDRRLSAIDYSRIGYVRQLHEIWIEWFGGFRLQDPFMPRHGTGSTADAGKIRDDKWRALSCDRAADVCFRYASLEKILDLPLTNATRCSKVVFVPKQFGKDRTICMEPAWLQYLQQGVASQLIRFTHWFHPMSNLVNIYSQDVNRRLCADAFLDRLCTLDLSDASDSVSWRLIKALTAGMPLQRYLYGCRSWNTAIDGRVVKFDKYAPMGSALCFPIECMLFASVVELAFRLHYGKASQGHHSGCSVYGDDIICPVEINHLVVDILTQLGFKVNTQKSFSGPYFESCGVEYLDGVRILTVRHPRNHLLFKKMMSPEQVSMVADLCQSLLEHGYLETRRILLLSLKGKYVQCNKSRVPAMSLIDFTKYDSILGDNPTTFWNSKLQSRCSRFIRISSEPRRARSDFLQWSSEHRRRSRSERMGRPKFWSPLSFWSEKGLLSLAKYGHLDLLCKGELEECGVSGTGRLQQRVRRLTRTACNKRPANS